MAGTTPPDVEPGHRDRQHAGDEDGRRAGKPRGRRATVQPIRRDAAALAGVLIQTVDACPAYRPLIDRLTGRALDLVESVTLATHQADPYHALLDADAALQVLRQLLALGLDLGVLTGDDHIAFSEQADRVGRQLGGWLRHVEREA